MKSTGAGKRSQHGIRKRKSVGILSTWKRRDSARNPMGLLMGNPQNLALKHSPGVTVWGRQLRAYKSHKKEIQVSWP